MTYKDFQAAVQNMDWLPAEQISDLMALAIQLDDAGREKLLSEVNQEEAKVNEGLSTIVQEQEHAVNKEVRSNNERNARNEEASRLTQIEQSINSTNTSS